jgi:uncharacterized protein YabE (DUF348 family)
MSELNDNNNNISYQWLSRMLLSIVGALMLIGIGWLKTSQDELALKVDAIPIEVQSVQDSITDIHEELSTVQQDHDDITLLKSMALNQQSWISAQIHANKAKRELYGTGTPAASSREKETANKEAVR